MDFQQSKTFTNITNAFQLERTISTTNLLHAERARQEGYIEIGDVFDVTARNHKEHARIFWRRLNNGILPSTVDNLQDSGEQEAYLGYTLYREYAATAREEGYDDIAALFNGIANIELNHNLNFNHLRNNILNNEVFCKPKETLWICMQCGNILSGLCAPINCPVCGFPQGYYRLYNSIEAL